MKSNLTPTEKRAKAWHSMVYREPVDLPATYRKLCEEVGELGEALIRAEAGGPERARQLEGASKEAGDVGVLLIHLARGLAQASRVGNGSLDALVSACLEKCEAMFARKRE